MRSTRGWGLLLAVVVAFSAALVGCGGSSTSSSTLTLANAAPPSGVMGTAYSFSFSASGGKAPYSWTISSGQLPAGLKLNSSSGTISGTPTVAGTASFMITVKDLKGQTASQASSITIAAAPAPAITNGNPPSGTVGTAYSFNFTATGGKTPYVWSVVVGSGSLPAGLTLNSSTGVLSGTPTNAETANFTIQVADANQSTATQAYSIVIAPLPPPVITNGNPSNGQVGTAYSFNFTASGGKTPYSWTVVIGSGSLPTGLTLASSSGLLSGTPATAGSFTFTIQVMDASAQTATHTYSIVIALPPPPVITNGNPPNGQVGSAYSFTFTATGGKTPYTWSVMVGSGTLPPGLLLQGGTGILSGTPSTTGTFNFAIQVTDSSGQTASHPYTIIISAGPPPNITNGPPPNGVVGTPYSFNFTATGGSTPYSWNVTIGQLPLGLTLKTSTGLLSGTPTTVQSAVFTVTVTDANSSTASQQYTVNITNAPPVLQSITVTPPSPSIDVAGTQQFTATGNYSDGSTQDLTASATWSSSAPTMVSISSSGLATALQAGTTPATITASFGGLNGITQMNVKAPNVITVSPVLPVVTIKGSQNFTATGKFADGTTADLTHFVTWTSSSTSVATITKDGKGIGVARGIATITAANSGISGTAQIDVTDKNFSNASLNGPYAFTLTGFDSRGPVFESGSITSDGSGNIISGVEDINASTLSTHVALSGTYSITPDGRGTLTLSGGGQTRIFNLILKSNSTATADNNAQIIQNDLQSNAIGALEKQDATAFHNSSIASATYVFRVGGIINAGQSSRLGLLTTDSTAATVSGTEDVNDAGAVTTNVSISGTLASVDSSTGRVTGTFAGSNYAVYIVSATKLHLLTIDASLPAVAGIAEKQTATAPPASGGYAFNIDTGGSQGRSWLIGQFDYSPTNVLDGTQLQDGGVNITVNTAQSSFTVMPNGRGILLENTDFGFRNFIVYVVSPTKMYMLLSNDSHAASGTAELQQPGPNGSFSLASLNGDFAFGAAETGESELTFVGQFVFDGSGNFYGVDDLSEPGTTATVVLLAGTYTVSSNGEVIMTVPSGAKVPQFTLFLISPNKAVFLGTPSPDLNGVAELQ